MDGGREGGEIRSWGHHLCGSACFPFNPKSNNQLKLLADWTRRREKEASDITDTSEYSGDTQHV